jgi:hypothetical protein
MDKHMSYDDGETLLSAAGRDAFERAQARLAQRAGVERGLAQIAALPRLRRLGGLVIVDRCPPELAPATAPDGVLVFEGEVRIEDHDPDLGELPVGDDVEDLDDEELLIAVRQVAAGQAAEAEAWRDHGQRAVAETAVMEAALALAEAEAARLRAALGQVESIASANRDFPSCARIVDVLRAA